MRYSKTKCIDAIARFETHLSNKVAEKNVKVHKYQKNPTKSKHFVTFVIRNVCLQWKSLECGITGKIIKAADIFLFRIIIIIVQNFTNMDIDVCHCFSHLGKSTPS